MVYSPVAEDEPNKVKELAQDSGSEAFGKMPLEANMSISKTLIASSETDLRDVGSEPNSDDEIIAVYEMSETSVHVVQTVADPTSSKLAALHHVS